MSTIYLDASAVTDPDLADRLALLTESGHRLVLVGPADHPAAGRAAWGEHAGALPADLPQDAWYLTGDPATCRDRQPGLRTVLIGPRLDGPRPTRCDTTVRDLREAVLEILASEAMS